MDLQLLTWWTGFGPGRAFLGAAFGTVVSDEVQERRVLLFCRLIGVSEERLPRLLRLFHVNSGFLGCAKYQASRAYTFCPLDDYDPELRPLIRKKSVDDSWHLVIPRSEMRRLQQAYAETSLQRCEFRLPDVVVLTGYELSYGLHPPDDLYVEAYRNRSFAAWIRR
jgi:hypothetical protein